GPGLNRLGADLDAVVDQQRLEPGIDECRQRRRERRAGAGLGPATGRLGILRLLRVADSVGGIALGRRRRIRDRLLEAAFDTLALTEDRLDVPGLDLLLEHRVRHAHGILPAWEEQPND